MQILEEISSNAIQALYYELNNYLITTPIYSKALREEKAACDTKVAFDTLWEVGILCSE